MVQVSLCHKGPDRLEDRVHIRDHGIFQRRLYGVGVCVPLEPANGGVEGARSRSSADSGRDFLPMPNGANASSTINRRPVLPTERAIVSISSGATVRGSISSTETPSAARVAQAVNAQGTFIRAEATTTSFPSRTTLALPKWSFVISLGHRAIQRQQFAMLEEQDGILAAQGMMQQTLGVVRIGRDDDAQTGEMSEHGIVVARMMRRRRMADANAAAQQDRHLEASVAHVLHLADLIEDLAHPIESEIGEHEIDHGSAPVMAGPAAQTDEATLADRRVAQAFGPKRS